MMLLNFMKYISLLSNTAIITIIVCWGCTAVPTDDPNEKNTQIPMDVALNDIVLFYWNPFFVIKIIYSIMSTNTWM